MGHRRQHLGIQSIGEPAHRASRDLQWNGVRREMRRVPRRPAAADVTVSACHAQSVGDTEHQIENRVGGESSEAPGDSQVLRPTAWPNNRTVASAVLRVDVNVMARYPSRADLP